MCLWLTVLLGRCSRTYRLRYAYSLRTISLPPGSKDIIQIFKQSAILTNKPYRKYLSNTFSVPKEFSVLFAADQTGVRHQSQSGAAIEQDFRVDYLMHTFITQIMSSPSLGPLATTFTENLISQPDAEASGPNGQSTQISMSFFGTICITRLSLQCLANS